MARNPRSYGRSGRNPLTNRTAGTSGTGVTGSTPTYTGRVRSDLRALADSQAISQPQAAGLGAGWLDVQAKVNQLQNSKAQIMAQGAAVLAEQAGSLPMRLTLAQRNIWESKNLASTISRNEDRHRINRPSEISGAQADDITNQIRLRAGQVALDGDLPGAQSLAEIAKALNEVDQQRAGLESGIGRIRSKKEVEELRGQIAVSEAKAKKYAVRGVDGKYLVDENGKRIEITEADWRARASSQLAHFSGERDLEAIRKSILENNILGYTDNYAGKLDQHVGDRVSAFLQKMKADAGMSEVQYKSFEERFKTLEKSEGLKRLGLSLVREAYGKDSEGNVVIDENLMETGLRFLDQTGQFGTTAYSLSKQYQTIGVEAIQAAQKIWADFKSGEIDEEVRNTRMAALEKEILTTQSATRPDVQRFYGMMNLADQMITDPEAMGINFLSDDPDERTNQVMGILQIMSGIQNLDPKMQGRQSRNLESAYTVTIKAQAQGGKYGQKIVSDEAETWVRLNRGTLESAYKNDPYGAYTNATGKSPYIRTTWGPEDNATRLLPLWLEYLGNPTQAGQVGNLLFQNLGAGTNGYKAFMGDEGIDKYLSNFIDIKTVESGREGGGRNTSREERTVNKDKLKTMTSQIFRLDQTGSVKTFTSSKDKFEEAVKEATDNAWKSRDGYSISKDGIPQKVGTTGDSTESLDTEYKKHEHNLRIKLKEEWKQEGHWDTDTDEPQLIGERHTPRDSAFINTVMKLIYSPTAIPGDYLNASHVADHGLHKEFTKLMRARLSNAAHTFGYDVTKDVKRLNWLMGQAALKTLRLAQEKNSNARWSSFFKRTNDPMGISLNAPDPYGQGRSDQHGGTNTLAAAYLYAMLGMENAPKETGNKKNYENAKLLGFHGSNPTSDSVNTAINTFNIKKEARGLWQ